MNKLETPQQKVKIEEEPSLERESELLAQNLGKAQEELGQVDPEKLSEEDKKSLGFRLDEILAIVGGLSGMALLSVEMAARLTHPGGPIDIVEVAVILGGLAGIIPYILQRAKNPG